jgi:hypothetical protein
MRMALHHVYTVREFRCRLAPGDADRYVSAVNIDIREIIETLKPCVVHGGFRRARRMNDIAVWRESLCRNC